MHGRDEPNSYSKADEHEREQISTRCTEAQRRDPRTEPDETNEDTRHEHAARHIITDQKET